MQEQLNKVQPVGQVEAELNKLEKAIELCSSQQQELGKDLAPLMRYVEADHQKTHEEESLVPMAERIRNLRYGVERISDSIKEVMERLEL